MLAEAPRGPLYGVPVAIKDEWPLPWRAERLRRRARRRTGAGGRRVGALPGSSRRRGGDRRGGEHARVRCRQHRPHLGVRPARNPWDTDRCPGGSSSGPGAAVAARLVGGAVGADGVGSIRYPAAYCGLTG